MGSPEYKLAKLAGWREVFSLSILIYSYLLFNKYQLKVADDLALDIDVLEIKNKWSNLRVTFKLNITKLRSKKSGQGTDDVSTVQWRHFRQMLFLESNGMHQSTASTSTLVLVISVSLLFQSTLNQFVFCIIVRLNRRFFKYY